ncbi:hypothetical protein YC2023_119074 [Brassica napus]
MWPRRVSQRQYYRIRAKEQQTPGFVVVNGNGGSRRWIFETSNKSRFAAEVEEATKAHRSAERILGNTNNEALFTTSQVRTDIPRREKGQRPRGRREAQI